MKRILVSIGLATLGASTVSALADSLTGYDSTKPWNVSLSLRGFYTDNENTSPKERSGVGFNVSPHIGLHLSSPQTDFIASYDYNAEYYDKKPSANKNHVDMDHTLDLQLQHQFSERYSITVEDTLAVGQEPYQLQQVGPISAPVRVPGDNFHNYGAINFDAQLTHLFGLELGYDNSFWQYDSTKFGWHNWDGTVDVLPTIPPTFSPRPPFSSITPSLAGQNNRIEQSAHLDSHWSLTPRTVLIVGYQFSAVDYTENQPIQAINPFLPVNLAPTNTPNVFKGNKSNIYRSSVQNSYSHYGYVGATHTFLPTLTGTIKIGARYTDDYNDPNGTTSIEPYVSLNGNWNYGKESYMQLGFTHDRSASDHAGGAGTNIVQESDTSVVYLTVHQQITPKFFTTFTGTFEDSVINAPGIVIDGEEDLYYILALDFEYRFTHNFSLHAGYSYDRLDAAKIKGLDGVSSGSYDKNTFYVGATVSY